MQNLLDYVTTAIQAIIKLKVWTKSLRFLSCQGLHFSFFYDQIKYLGLKIMPKMNNYTVEKADNILTKWSKLTPLIRGKRT